MQHGVLCASCFIIDFENKKVLLVHNDIDGQWIQPGGTIDDGETPIQACNRIAFEKTGISINVVNTIFDQEYISPIDVREYDTNIGHMLDIQYMATPNNNIINEYDGSYANWFDIDTLEMNPNIDKEIIYKVNKLYKLFKNEKSIKARKKVI